MMRAVSQLLINTLAYSHERAPESKKGLSAGNADPLVCLTVGLLSELGTDRRERAVELCPKALHDRDNRNRTSCDQTILNGRRAALISQEDFEFPGHA
jgi:hypothetical protein